MESNDVNLGLLVRSLIKCSERAARIAQICRSDNDLFSLLIQEKKDGEKNMRFVQDFKTLADVLVQETVRWNICKKFPSLHSNIFGEENNHFENTLGESIEVVVSDSPEDTIILLSTVLDGRRDSAKALAEGIYGPVDEDLDVSEAVSDVVVPADTIAIWVDPIDCTGEYVHGKGQETADRLVPNGLKCVCVLIGAYDRNTGLPIAGVVNQPFFARSPFNKGWVSKYYWAVCHDIRESSIVRRNIPTAKKKLVVSSSEDKNLLQAIVQKYDIFPVAGSGYKSLLVACGDADLYILSHPTTYYWDTCAPHALLSAVGGGLIDFKSAVKAECLTIDDLPLHELKYTSGLLPKIGKLYSNVGGIIAYRDHTTVIELLQVLRESGFGVLE